MIKNALSPLCVYEKKHLEKDFVLSFLKNKKSKLAIIVDNAPIASKSTFIDSFNENQVVVFDSVQPNPRSSDINQMYNNPLFKNCEVIIGIGGGSVLDSAKALAMLKTNGGNLDDYLGNNPKCKIEHRCAPLILIPTTAGTGSEVTKVGVYTSDSGRKYTLGSPLMHAHFAILVQDMILNAPPALIASTGLDALDHALESIWNKNATTKTLKLSRKAAIEVLENIKPLYEAAKLKQTSYALARKMLHASCMAGMAFNLTGTSAGHALSFVLSETWHIPHGTACAFTLNGVFELACEIAQTRKQLAIISKHFHPEVNNQDLLISLLKEDIRRLTVDLNQPTCFDDLQIKLSKDEIDQNFARSFDDPKMHNQIPKATKDNIYPLLRKLC